MKTHSCYHADFLRKQKKWVACFRKHPYSPKLARYLHDMQEDVDARMPHGDVWTLHAQIWINQHKEKL